MAALKKIAYRIGIRMLRIGCCLVRRSGINLREDEEKSLNYYHGVRNLVAVTAHYDDGDVSEIYGLTIEITPSGRFVNK